MQHPASPPSTIRALSEPRTGGRDEARRSGKAPRSRLLATGRSGLLVAALAVTSGSASAQIIYVDAAATGMDDGTSWCDAYNNDLQDALASPPALDDIWIARGTYKPGTLQTDTFIMISQVDLFGGFLGNAHPAGCANAEMTLGDRPDPAIGTILSGNIDGIPGTSAGDIEHVVTFPSNSFSIRLDGLTIRYGHADGANLNGGGVLMDAMGTTDILFDECRFRDNFAEGSGGGLYANRASFDMKFCVFRRNHAGLVFGGGVHLEEIGDVHVFSTLFVGNRSLQGGGGMSIVGTLDSLAGPLVYSCEFRGNNSHQGGGVYVDANVGGLFGNCTVVNNTAFELPGVPPAPGVGGGFYVNLGGDGVMNIYNTIVWDNEGTLLPSSIEGPDAGLVTVTYSDIEDLLGPWPGIGNIMADPLFVSPMTADYNLKPGSPCADAGNDPDTPPAIPGIPPDVLDLDEDVGGAAAITPYDLVKGNRREKNDPAAADSGVDGGPPPCALAGGLACEAIVDMGAHESEG